MSLTDKLQFVLLGSAYLLVFGVGWILRWHIENLDSVRCLNLERLTESSRDVQSEIVHLISVNRRLEARVQQLEARLHDDGH